MARKREETIVLFKDVRSITRKFSDEQFGVLIRAAFSYRFEGAVYSGDDVAVDVAFQAVANQIDRYSEFCEKQSSNAKSGGVKPDRAKCSQSQPKDTPILSTPILSSPIQEGVPAAKPPTHSRFSPPSVEDVREYCKSKGYNVDPERFVDYYTSNGWKVGRNPMKDWKAAVRTWAKKGGSKGTPVQSFPDDDLNGIF